VVRQRPNKQQRAMCEKSQSENKKKYTPYYVYMVTVSRNVRF